MTKIASPHPQQTERLAALHRYGILDTPKEAEFDEIVELASDICGVKISVINFIDAERQWFKAETGLNTRETPLDTSICSHVILQDDFVEIPDTSKDPRTSTNPLCLADGGLKFYSGALLKTNEGYPIGTLCVLHDQPHNLNDLQRRTLKVLARQVMRELDLRLALETKDILSREVDHRVKNSLQTVSSLVRLYKNKAGPESVDAFDAVARRIEAISLLHQEMHEASAQDRVPLKRFLLRIAELLRQSTPPYVTLSMEVAAVEVDSSQASGFAVIISEFVANSIKHAFADGRGGTISISLKRDEDQFVLECHDDGLGTAATSRPLTAAEGLGQKLKEITAAQLGGVIIRDVTPEGYCMRLSIPAARFDAQPEQ